METTSTRHSMKLPERGVSSGRSGRSLRVMPAIATFSRAMSPQSAVHPPRS